MKERLAIVGSHPRTRVDGPFDDPEVDIWVFNEALSNPNSALWCKRADAVFQMHIPAIWRNPENRNDPHYLEWLMGGNTPTIYMIDDYPEVPKCVKYPFDEIREKLLSNFIVDSEKGRKDFYTSTVAYSTALAVYLGYKVIDWYGIELEVDAEYRYQRDSSCFWAGFALGYGVKFTAHSRMFDMPLYGIESFISINKDEFWKNIHRYEPETKRLQKEYETAKAKTMELWEKFKNNHKLADELREAARAQAEAGQKFGLVDGAMQENQRFLARAETMEKASGSYAFSKHEFERDQGAILKKREEVMVQWQQSASHCQELMDQIDPVFDSQRRKMVAELKTAIDAYVKLSVIIGMYTGGADEDMRLKKLLDNPEATSSGGTTNGKTS